MQQLFEISDYQACRVDWHDLEVMKLAYKDDSIVLSLIAQIEDLTIRLDEDVESARNESNGEWEDELTLSSGKLEDICKILETIQDDSSKSDLKAALDEIAIIV